MRSISEAACYGVPRRPRLLMLIAMLAAAAPAAGLDVWVDFISDFHDGENGAPNGVADWIDELNEATQTAGVGDFTPAERATIEANIVADLEVIYAGYEIDFVLEEPSGLYDVIYMARDNDHPDVSSTNFGSAPVDLGNQDTNVYTTRNGNPSGVPKVTTANFDGNLETSDSRARQIVELSTALAGTAAHELGHTFGLLHHFVYSNPRISPSNYANTGSLQNVHILGTGNTGISESERERRRSLSPFSRVMMDITGGSNASSFEENIPLVAGGLVSDRSEEISGDAGDTLATARPLSFEIGPTSGVPISFLEADIDSAGDVDIFSFSIEVDAVLTTHVISERLDLGNDEFDSVLELLDSAGDVLYAVDDTTWDDDQFIDLESPEDEEDDPFLVNLPLTPGDYFLRVSPATEDISDFATLGDEYWLVTSLTLTSPDLPGDYNRDGFVDAADYTVWRDTSDGLVDLPFEGADGNGDGAIDAFDLTVWSDAYGTSLAALSVPEPTSAGAVIMLLAAAAFRRFD